MSTPVISLRQTVTFPGNVEGTTGIGVEKANGTWTFKTDWSEFDTHATIPTSPTNYMLTYDTATGVYQLVLSSFIAGYDKVSRSGDTMSGLLTLSGPPTAINHAATKDYVDNSSNVVASNKVSKSGDTMTGDLTIQKSAPAFILNNTNASAQTYITTAMRNALPRWQVLLNNDAESGSNAGSSLQIARYNDAGTYIDSPVILDRALGKLTISGTLVVDGTVTPNPPIWVQRVIYKGSNLQYGIGFFPGADNTHAVEFYNATTPTASLVGTITNTSTTTAYNTSSDERLKEDLKSFDAGRIIDETKVYDFAWKTAGVRSYGVIAQQAVEVYPQAVTYDDKKDWWGIDYSKYVPVLLQELKALRARVEELEATLSSKPPVQQ